MFTGTRDHESCDLLLLLVLLSTLVQTPFLLRDKTPEKDFCLFGSGHDTGRWSTRLNREMTVRTTRGPSRVGVGSVCVTGIHLLSESRRL